MNGSLKKLQSLVRLREGLIKRGRSHKTSAIVLSELKKVKVWMEGNPKIKDEHAEGYVRRHPDAIHLLLPGKGCSSSKSWREWVDQILNGQQ